MNEPKQKIEKEGVLVPYFIPQNNDFFISNYLACK